MEFNILHGWASDKVTSIPKCVTIKVCECPRYDKHQGEGGNDRSNLFIKPLEAMTKQISGDKYATLSQVIPLVHCGLEQLKTIQCSKAPSITLKEKLLQEFTRRFGNWKIFPSRSSFDSRSQVQENSYDWSLGFHCVCISPTQGTLPKFGSGKKCVPVIKLFRGNTVTIWSLSSAQAPCPQEKEAQ